MTQNPIKELIRHWPNRREFAAAVGADVEAVHKWAQHGRIPAPFQLAVTRAAARFGLSHVTPEWMLMIHAGDADCIPAVDNMSSKFAQHNRDVFAGALTPADDGDLA